MSTPAERTERPERPLYLALLALPALIWGAQFLLSYGTASFWCASAPQRDASLGAVRPLIVGYTVLALIALAFVARHARSRHQLAGEPAPHDADTADDRHRFLGLATLLISVLAAIGSVYLGLTAVFFGTCR